MATLRIDEPGVLISQARSARHRCDILLVGLDEDDGVREAIAMMAADTDEFWSDGLEDLLRQGAKPGDLQAGALGALELRRENVVTTLSANFGIELDWHTVTIDADSPLIDDLVVAATSDDA